MATEGWSRGTRESVAAAARCFGSRGELARALRAKGWAVFISKDGKSVVGAPKGKPVPGGCPCCSGVEAVRLDGKKLLTGGCAISASSAMWGDGPKEERGYLLVHQGARPELDGVTVTVDEIPTPQEAEEIMHKIAAEAS
jgi:hypothetical protein